MDEKITASGVEYDALLTITEVARAFHVDVRTVANWDRDGRWPDGSVVKTPGGHRRFKAAAVAQMLADRSAS